MRAFDRIAAVALCLVSFKSQAHDVRGTIISLDVGRSAVEARIQIPVGELVAALQLPRGSPSPDELTLRTYLAAHFSLAGRSGAPFAQRLTGTDLEVIEQTPCVVARVSLEALPPDDARWFEVRTDLIVHSVVSHTIYVLLRHDAQTGLLDGEPEVLGLMHFQHTTLTVDRSSGSFWVSFRALFTFGVRHIAEGTDHLLFLLMLLLPASLLAREKRWQAGSDAKRSVVATLVTVSAFTLGHSVTLLLGAFNLARLPVAPVEQAIALSVLITAIHALRPIFPRREKWVAAGFGLVHGLAFATVLRGLGVDSMSLLTNLLAFNLGIEAMQFALIALTLPWLVMMSMTPVYRFFRIALASLTGLIACGWFAERTFGVATWAEPVTRWAQGHALVLLISLMMAALSAKLSFTTTREPKLRD